MKQWVPEARKHSDAVDEGLQYISTSSFSVLRSPKGNSQLSKLNDK